MKKFYNIALMVFALSLLHSIDTLAQDDLDELLKGSLSDANKLVEGYIGPAMRGISGGLNQGWYNTAKPHKTLGVDFTVTTSMMFVPSSEKFYTVDNNQLDKVEITSFDGQPVSPTGSAQVPTIFGPDKTPTYRLRADPTTTPPTPAGPEFDGPPGLDLKENIKIADALPVPVYHLGIGLPKSTDLKLRWSPTLNLGDAKYTLFGIGVMHDFKQWIPGIKNLPFDMSAFVGYTKTKLDVDISGTSAGENQRGIVEFKSTTIQGLISKKISVLTFYGGVGYNIGKANVDMTGTYDLDDDGTAEATDPVALSFTNNGLRATAGMRLKLAIFTFHGDYTLAKFNALSVGFGINVR